MRILHTLPNISQNSSKQNLISPNKTPDYNKQQVSKECVAGAAFSYPKNYYTASFLGGRYSLSLQEQINRLNTQNLPDSILFEIKNTLASGNTASETLYTVHQKVYGNLENCTSLDEAKALYPEFENVINAKDLDESKMSPTLKRINNGEIDGIKIEDLTLALLKAHYGKAAGLSSKENFFNLSKDTILKMFGVLNIERLDGQYLRLLSDCSPIRREKCSQNWSAEKRAVHAAKANEIWSDKERKETQSERRKQWFKEHPEAAEEISERLKGRTLSPETRAKVSTSKKQFYKENPEFAQLRSQSFKEHKDLKEKMCKIAREEFPYLKVILQKQAAHIPLDAYENKYIKNYYKRCAEAQPNGQKIVGEIFSKLWKEFKEQKEDK